MIGKLIRYAALVRLDGHCSWDLDDYFQKWQTNHPGESIREAPSSFDRGYSPIMRQILTKIIELTLKIPAPAHQGSVFKDFVPVQQSDVKVILDTFDGMQTRLGGPAFLPFRLHWKFVTADKSGRKFPTNQQLQVLYSYIMLKEMDGGAYDNLLQFFTQQPAVPSGPEPSAPIARSSQAHTTTDHQQARLPPSVASPEGPRQDENDILRPQFHNLRLEDPRGPESGAAGAQSSQPCCKQPLAGKLVAG